MTRSAPPLDVREGIMPGGLPYRELGHGPPLVIFPGLGPSNTLARGIQRLAEIYYLTPLARHATVCAINRRIGLRIGTTHTDLAADYAHAISTHFDLPVDVLGFSTGGHIAQQFAIDYPQLVRRLILAVTASRLSPVGYEASRRCAEYAVAGDTRRAFVALTPALVGSPVGRQIIANAQWLVTPLLLEHNWNPNDMIATLRADLIFDVTERLDEISAPTLLIGGTRDPSYPPSLVTETAHRIPNAQLHIYPRDHGGVLIDPRFAHDIAVFLR